MNESRSALAALPYFPLDPAWVEQSAAFRDADARMGPAYLRVLLAAWRGLPAASVPHSHEYLANVTGLSVELVGQKFRVLTEGFVLLDDARLHHVQLAKLAFNLNDRYGPAIEEFAVASAMTMQAPDQFAMVSVETARPSARGKRVMPKGFGYGMHPELSVWAEENGYPDAQARAWIMGRFIDYCSAKNPAYKDWAAAFRTWAANEIQYGRRPPTQPLTVASNRTQPVVTQRGKAEAAREHNADLFSRLSSPRARSGGAG